VGLACLESLDTVRLGLKIQVNRLLRSDLWIFAAARNQLVDDPIWWTARKLEDLLP
jgi:hypothetical protein